nr:hypothetical protein [Tanacetum cinerariifolium]
MVSYEAFACPCGDRDVVLRESYKPKTRSKLYHACPRSKVNNHMSPEKVSILRLKSFNNQLLYFDQEENGGLNLALQLSPKEDSPTT